MKKNQHVVPHENGWAVKGEGNEKYTAIVDTKAEAVDIARDIARNLESELLIHNLNGQISQRNSYGYDPYPPKG